MQNLFIGKDEEFIVKVVVATDKNGTIYCDINEESLRDYMKDMVNLNECEIQEYSVKFKRPSFGDTKDLYDSIFSMDSSASVSFNPVLARFRKIVALIKEWDLTEDRSFEKPTEAEIEKLHPIIANAIGIQLDVETGGLLS